MPRSTGRRGRLRSRIVGLPFDDRMFAIAMLLLTVVAPGAFVASHQASEVRDLARSLQRSGIPAVAHESTVDVVRRGPRSGSWAIGDVRVRLPGLAGEVSLEGTHGPDLGGHAHDEIGRARLENLPAYRPPVRVRYQVTGTTVAAMTEADMHREAGSNSPEVAFASGCAATVLWVLGWAVLALVLVDERQSAAQPSSGSR